MSNYKIHQIQLSELEVDVVNSMDNPLELPKYKANLDAMTGKFEEALNSGFYEVVATIDANNLNEVFQIGNIGPEANITRLSSMHSISVGDIIEDESGMLNAVRSFGFENMTFGLES